MQIDDRRGAVRWNETLGSGAVNSDRNLTCRITAASSG